MGTAIVSEQKVLIVEDEPMAGEVVERHLRRDGYEVRTALDGQSALQAFDAFEPDLVVLDVMLPRVDGMEVCRRIRAASAIPIIMLTARGQEIDKLLGLELGADDYVTKPFSPRELAARVKAVLRRAARESHTGGETLAFGELKVNARTRTVIKRYRAGAAHGTRVRPAPSPGEPSRPGVQPGAAHGRGVGLPVRRRYGDGHRPHAPPARQDRGGPLAAQVSENGVGRWIQV
jgi:CheY-like chemotaxis protein